MRSGGGFQAQADVDSLATAFADNAAVVEEMAARTDISEAKALQAKMTEVLKVQEQLRACEAKGANADRTEIFTALSEARELEMDLDIMGPLGRRLKELDAEYQKAREADDAPLEDDGAYEDATKQAEEQ